MNDAYLTGIRACGKTFPCKGVVFDKDGTLLDIFPMLAALGRERLKHLSLRVKSEALASVERCMGFNSGTGEVKPMGPLASAAKRDEVAVTAGALWLVGIPWYRAITIAKESYEEAEKTLDPMTGVTLLPGARDCVSALKESGLSLFIVTGDGHERTEKMLDTLGLFEYFSLIVGADDVSNTKPSPDGVFLCCERSGLRPQDLVVVGDAPQDALMGKKAGAKTLGVLTGVSSYDELEGLFDLVVPGVQDIKPAPSFREVGRRN